MSMGGLCRKWCGGLECVKNGCGHQRHCCPGYGFTGTPMRDKPPAMKARAEEGTAGVDEMWPALKKARQALGRVRRWPW